MKKIRRSSAKNKSRLTFSQLIRLPSPNPMGSLCQSNPINFRVLPLTKGYFVLIDSDDYEWSKKRKWCVCVKNKKNNYAYATTTLRKKEPLKSRPGHGICLHRLLFLEKIGPIEPLKEIDHKNRDSLDCRKHNLRISSRRENVINSGPQRGQKYKGVKWNRGAWVATAGGRNFYKYLGRFQNPEDAARVYNEFVKKEYGEFAYLNPL